MSLLLMMDILDKLCSIAIALYCIDWWFDWFIGWLIDWSFGWLDVIEGYETVEGMVPFCALRAAGLILRMQLQQLLGLKKTLCNMQEKFEISRLTCYAGYVCIFYERICFTQDVALQHLQNLWHLQHLQLPVLSRMNQSASEQQDLLCHFGLCLDVPVASMVTRCCLYPV